MALWLGITLIVVALIGGVAIGFYANSSIYDEVFKRKPAN